MLQGNHFYCKCSKSAHSDLISETVLFGSDDVLFKDWIDFVLSSYPFKIIVHTLCREMIVPMAREAKAAREANGLVILQRGMEI